MVVLLALVAALLFALAAAAEQRAASQQRQWRGWRQGLRFAARLAASPLWLAGWLADVLGFGAQAGALHVGSLSVVQPLLVTTLLFSLALAAWGSGRRLRAADWLGGVAASTGLALVLSGRRDGTATSVHGSRLLAMMLLAGLAAVVLVVVARLRRPGRAVPLAVAAGLLFAVGASLTKLVTGSLADGGIAAAAVTWPGYALALVSLTGLSLQQTAFATGSLPATMTAITITDPLLSYLLGITGFGERAPHGSGAALAVLGLGLAAAGVAVLARSPLLRGGPGVGGAGGRAASDQCAEAHA
jgi:drug/metabolite transporter (DMT)-like permease